MFTPILGQVYEAVRNAGKTFEVVFISSDKSEHEFDEYFGEMKWLALPFEDRAAKAKLAGKFGVQGIPTLVLLDENGDTITRDGRDVVMETLAEGYPWKPKPLDMEELLKGPNRDFLIRGDGSKEPIASLKGKTVAFLFSAHW
jgi:nucleoredoxin